MFLVSFSDVYSASHSHRDGRASSATTDVGRARSRALLLASFEGIGILISRDRDLLDNFPGALLMVTHDRLLSEAVTQIAWETIHGEKLVRLQIV